MSPTVWIKHPETGAVVEVPSAALPMYRQSNWDVLSDEEFDELERSRAEEIDTAEREMQAKAEFALSRVGTSSGEDERTPEELAELGETALAAAEAPPPEDPDGHPAVAEEQPDHEKDAGGRRTKKGNA